MAAEAAAAAVFGVIVVTAPPVGQPAEAGGPFVKVDGREVLLRSVELFLNRDNVKQIQLVINPDAIEEAKRKFGAHLGFSGVKLVAGGPTWAAQLKAAAGTVSADATHVIVHDAARPAVSYSDIDELMAQARRHPAVVLTAPLRAALIETDDGSNPVATHRPDRFVQLLTPQAYDRKTFTELAQSGAELHASRLTLVKGSPLNVRVGGSGDASLVKQMLNMLPKPKMKAPSSPFDEAQW